MRLEAPFYWAQVPKTSIEFSRAKAFIFMWKNMLIGCRKSGFGADVIFLH
jgi:hypothetical protein